MVRPLNAPARRLPAALALAASAALLAACGSDESPEDTGDAPVDPPAAAAFPKPQGTLDDLIAEIGPTQEIVAPAAGAVFEPGDKRLGIGLFDVGGTQITDADVAEATQARDDRGRPALDIRMTEEGGRKLGELTRANLPEEGGAFANRLAIAVRGEVRTAPLVRDEIRSAAVIDGPQSVVFDEAENRLHAQKGILAWCFNEVA